jgi:cytochrome c
MRKWIVAVAMIAGLPAAAMAADAENGKTVFNKCKACHQVDKNAVGPHLAGVVGRKAGSVEGFAYSDAVKKSGLTWDEATLDKWLQGPSKLVPGTHMIFAGIKDEGDRADLIAYLKTLPAVK